MNIKKNLPLILLLATCSASATEVKPYVSAFGGIDFGSKSDIYGHNPAGMLRDIDVKYKNSFIYGLSVGTNIYQGSYGSISAEFEYANRDLKTKSLSLNSVDRSLNGERGNSLKINSYMANVIYESNYIIDKLKYSMGAGIGLANMSYDVNYLVNNAATPTQVNIKSTNNPLAYQFMLGLAYDFTENIAFLYNVKYFSVKDHNVNRYKLNNGPGLESVLNSGFDDSWSMNLGLRYTF
ncbi:outer membrane protein [Serratia fonticola]|uniref:outer membrane protein n=1 Tax=Serratia fonticola TaxID=47917 RepID=UPI0015C5AA09|nr:outer membrane beta-barrel protein [Serratia fonticola]NYA16433.1 outer membrane beta-barrel protein [Serratia fonticola]